MLTIYYDNYCANCTRFAGLIQKLNWFHSIKIKQLRNPNHINEATGIDLHLAEQQIASYDTKWNYGFSTIFKIILNLPLFWILIPFFWILQISGLGQYLYLQWAVKRKIIPMHCDDTTCKHY